MLTEENVKLLIVTGIVLTTLTNVIIILVSNTNMHELGRKLRKLNDRHE